MHVESDVAIVGAGAAGLPLARWLARPPEGARRLTAVLLAAPPGPARVPPRTWCFREAGAGPYAVLVASWQRLRARSGGGRTVRAGIATLRCKMLYSDALDALDALVGGEIAASRRGSRVEAVVDRVASAPGGAVAHARRAGGDRLTVRARWVFDSRPLAEPPPARAALSQHFRGGFVRSHRSAFDPSVVHLMDFRAPRPAPRTPQPAHGFSFG
ncbi:lycopene cyclase family protein [Streptomyces buecherae]|uniref:lycopene cyclase family protein n=1 Tax=Streptomyces buecherae TaxID=2763006 RepID=UPI0027DF25F6|nr:lycopene cyclase family protein [Streptomyces buecherae]